jgi:very-short-patch-repair endonuclease
LQQILAEGMSRSGVRRLVERGELERLLPRVYRLVAIPRTPDQEAMAAVLWAGESSVISGGTAASLHELDGGWRPRPIEVTATKNLASPVPWLRVHRTKLLGPGDVAVRKGIPVTSPARTLFDIAGHAHFENVELALDDGLRKGYYSIEYLKKVHRRLARNGRNGAGVMTTLLARRSSGYVVPKSPLEGRVVQLMRNVKLPEALRQHRIRVRGRIYYADFAYPQIRVVIEAQSRRHHFSPDDWQDDLRRKSDLACAGWRLIELTWKDVTTEQARTKSLLRALRDEVLSQMRAG